MNKQENDNALDILNELQHELKIYKEAANLLEKALLKHDGAAIREIGIFNRVSDGTLQNIIFDLGVAVFKAYPLPTT